MEAQGVPQAVQLNGASPLYCLSCRSSHSFVVGFMRACLEKVFLWGMSREGLSLGLALAFKAWNFWHLSWMFGLATDIKGVLQSMLSGPEHLLVPLKP